MEGKKGVPPPAMVTTPPQSAVVAPPHGGRRVVARYAKGLSDTKDGEEQATIGLGGRAYLIGKLFALLGAVVLAALTGGFTDWITGIIHPAFVACYVGLVVYHVVKGPWKVTGDGSDEGSGPSRRWWTVDVGPHPALDMALFGYLSISSHWGRAVAPWWHILAAAAGAFFLWDTVMIVRRLRSKRRS